MHSSVIIPLIRFERTKYRKVLNYFVKVIYLQLLIDNLSVLKRPNLEPDNSRDSSEPFGVTTKNQVLAKKGIVKEFTIYTK